MGDRKEAARKANATRKANNHFRKMVVAFEQGVTNAGIAAKSQEDFEEIVEALDDIQNSYQQRMEDAELEIIADLNEDLGQLVDKHGWEVVQAAAEMIGAITNYAGQLNFDYELENSFENDSTLAWVKEAPIEELHEHYDEALADNTLESLEAAARSHEPFSGEPFTTQPTLVDVNVDIPSADEYAKTVDTV
jgi:hypothetical protein